MKIPSSHAHTPERAEVAMTPMIDVVFLLLIFFLWTSSFQAIETLLPSHLTASQGGTGESDLTEEDFERIVIRLIGTESSDVHWQINGQPIDSLAQLQTRLHTLASIRADLPVIIDPDGGVAFGSVVDAYDASLNGGFSNIQFTAQGVEPVP